jgi:hypothetical protein
LEYDAQALHLMRALKEGIDPYGIMNPGKLIPLPSEAPVTTNPTIDLRGLKERVIKVSNWDEGAVEDDVSSGTDTTTPAMNVQKTQSWYGRMWGGSKS